MGKMSHETLVDLENRRLRYEQAGSDCRSLVFLARTEAPERKMAWMLSRLIDVISTGAPGRRASTILRQRSDQFKQPTSPSFQGG